MSGEIEHVSDVGSATATASRSLGNESGRAARKGQPRVDWTGKFVEQRLEQAFRKDNLEPLRRFLSFSVALASATFLAFAVHDALVVPEVRGRAWPVRFGVFVPACTRAEPLRSASPRTAPA